MTPVTVELDPCPDELLKCEWMKLDQLLLSDGATPLTQRACQLLSQAKQCGTSGIDISMEELSMPYTGWTSDKTYKLFLRKSE